MSQSTSTSSTGAQLSQVPALRSFEFDKHAVGAVKTSVNQFRGVVALPLDFLTLPGRQGLDVKISALYTGTVARAVTTWNVDEPTGILGLGWDMPFESIVVDKAGSGSPTSDTYYLLSGGSASPLVKDGQAPDGRWSFQLRNYQFWRILYDPRGETWTIVKEDGSTSTYGGRDGDAQAVQWGVKWGNWIGGSSLRPGQERYAVAWNLASSVSAWGHAVRYSYLAVERRVGSSDGLAFTQASYLQRIVDSYGRVVTFRYGAKFGAQNPSPRGIVEYQARHAQRPEPNAYQDKYETLYLDRVEVDNAEGERVSALQFTYDFLNLAPSGDAAYPLLWKRCLRSVYGQGPAGESLPGLLFEYSGAGATYPGALEAITYPEGGRARYTYKPTLIHAPKNVSVSNPLPGSTPGVWYGDDYVVFTWCQDNGALSAQVYSWNGRWVSQDLTDESLRSAQIDPASLTVSAQAGYIAISFRNRAAQRDELYLYRRDPAAFGRFTLYLERPIYLPLARADAAPSTFLAGADFVLAWNNDYTGTAFKGFAYDWRTRGWSDVVLLPSSSDARAATGCALGVRQNYYIVAFYFGAQRRATFQIFYRDLDGAWHASQSWSNDGLDVLTSEGRLLFTWNAQPSYAVATYVTGSTADTIRYSLRVFQWNEAFEALNPSRPKVIDLETPVTNDEPRLAPFRTVAVSDFVANNLANLRDVGGDLSTGESLNWLRQDFTPRSAASSLRFASGSDVAVMCESGAGAPSNQLLVFDPNFSSQAGWSFPSGLAQDGRQSTVSGDYLTVGRYVYFRGVDGAWRALEVQLAGLTDEASVQNRAPLYVAYQAGEGGGTRSYVVFLRNGQARPPLELPGDAQKICVPPDQARPGTLLAGPRFLVSYPSWAASFDAAPSLTLYDLEDRDLGDFARLTPVGTLEIEDPYAPDDPYVQSFFYANSEQSQIAYNPGTGLAQYPLVFSLPGVRSLGETPPSEQPQGRSEFQYSNGLSPQSNLGYPQGWIYNYQDVLNGMLLAQRDYDAANRLVSSQVNYWMVYTVEAATARQLFGGYVRLLRTVNQSDGVSQDSASEYEATSGLQRYQEQTYYDTDGRKKRLRSEVLYAWEVPAYADAFRARHLLNAVAQTTKSVSDDNGSNRVYIESQATTWRNWAAPGGGVACSDPNACRLAQAQVYQWTTPGAQAPQFDFGGADRSAWRLTSEIVARSEPAGLIREQRNTSGVPASFLYDKEQRYLVAKFPTGSLLGDEVGYYGFETYEDGGGWQLGAGATIVPQQAGEPIDAHTGTRSLRLAPGASGTAGVARTFRPARAGQAYVFSAWVKLPQGFDPAAGAARFVVSVSGSGDIVAPFPATFGAWVYLSQVIDLPALVPGAAPGSVSVGVRGENLNAKDAVLVDDLRFSPLACLFDAHTYDTRYWLPDALVGANGESSRSVYDAAQEPAWQTNASDQTSQLTLGFFSRAAHQGAFSAAEPNQTVTVQPAGGGELSTFTRGDEWQREWQAPAGTWQLGPGFLSQPSTGREGTLTLRGAAGTDVALRARFTCLEPVTRPMGVRLGTSLRVEWDPAAQRWRLLDAGGAPLAPDVDWTLFTLPAEPYAAELSAGVVSAGLLQAFTDAGYALPAGTVVAPGAVAGSTWDLSGPSGLPRYALARQGATLAVQALWGDWTLIAGGQTAVFFVAGRRLFSFVAETPFDAPPALFFGTRVALATLASARQPQARVTFEDAAGNMRQTQVPSGARAAVSQVFSDSMGRQAVRTKAAWVEPAPPAPLLAYRGDFAALDWTTGLMTGLVAAAYPDDGGYPYSRDVYERSTLARVIEQGLPGAPFRVGGGHAARVSYGNNDGGAFGLPAEGFLKTATANPNGDVFYQLTSQLGQVVAKVSLKSVGGGLEEICNFTRFDAAGNPFELRAPNFFAPPEGSQPSDWAVVQSFDYAGRVLSSRSGAEAPTEMVYDPAGNLRFAQDPQGALDGNFNYWRYDDLGRPVEAGYVAGAWSRAQLQQIADNDRAWPATPPTWRRQYFYDRGAPDAHSIGRVFELRANNGDQSLADVSETYAYDVAGNTRVAGLSVSGAAGDAEQAVAYEHDALGNITRIAYPPTAGGEQLDVFYRYNAFNQVAAVAETPDFATPLASFDYEANGRPQREVLATASGRVVTRSFAFNSPLWLASLRDESASTTLFGETLAYTEGGYEGAGYHDGTIAAAASERGEGLPAPSFRYSYDALGQIGNAQDPANPGWDLGVVAPVSYDPNGNFRACAQGGQARRYDYYAGTQRVRQVVEPHGGAVQAAYTWDANGAALTSDTAAAGLAPAYRLRLRYDPGTRLTAGIDDDQSGVALGLRYGARGQRVLKDVSQAGAPTARKLYVHGTNSYPLYERVEADGGVVETLYVFGPGGLLALRRGGRTFLTLKDHLGSVRAVLDDEARIVASYDYLAYGALAQAQEPQPDFLSYLYTGQELDREVGLYNYRARFYAAELGRFLAVDPRRQFFSPYIYAANNPVLYVDPSGTFSIGSLFSAIAGAIIGAIEILVGVVVDVIAGVLEVITGGLSTPASIALAALAGTFYGAGISAISYSVFNFNDFSWKDYGIQMGIGAVAGAISFGFGAAGAALAEGVTGVQAAVQAGQQVSNLARAGSYLIEGGVSAVGSVAAGVVSNTLSDVASGVTPGTDLATGALWDSVTAGVGLLIPTPAYKSGWGNLGKRVLAGVAKEEVVGLSVNTTRNLVSGDSWDQGLLDTAFGGALWGSLGALQAQSATQEALDFSSVASAAFANMSFE